MLVRMAETSYVGLHLFCKISRQIPPNIINIILIILYYILLIFTVSVDVGVEHLGKEFDHRGLVRVLLTELKG